MKAKVIVSQQQKHANPELPVFVTVKKLEEKESKRSETGSKMDEAKKMDPIVELLESPTWKHRKEDVQFSPFKPNCEVKKNSKRCMDRISLLDCSKQGRAGSQGGNSLRKSTDAARKSQSRSPAGSNRGSIRLSIQKPVPEYQDEENADQSIDDFAQYVKHKERSPAGKGSPRKATNRGKDSISSPIRAHLYRSAEVSQASPRHGQKRSVHDYSMYLASPSRVATSPAKIPKSPSLAPTSPSKAPSSPFKDGCSTLRDPDSPTKAPTSPAKKWWDHPAAAAKKMKNTPTSNNQTSRPGFTIQLKRTQVKFAAPRPSEEIITAKETKEARLARLKFAKNL